MKKIILFWAIIGWQSAFSQFYDLRNIVLNSDFIIVVETEQEKISTKPINDFYYERSVTFSNIDKVIKQNGKINFLNQSIFYPKEGNDFLCVLASYTAIWKEIKNIILCTLSEKG